jgi:hypothetical protein
MFRTPAPLGGLTGAQLAHAYHLRSATFVVPLTKFYANLASAPLKASTAGATHLTGAFVSERTPEPSAYR